MLTRAKDLKQVIDKFILSGKGHIEEPKPDPLALAYEYIDSIHTNGLYDKRSQALREEVETMRKDDDR